MLERLDWPDGDFRLARTLWPPREADALFARLRAEIDWHRHHVRVFGREIAAPRLSSWHGDPQARYAYSGVLYEPRPWTPALIAVRERIEAALALRFNGVLANLYRSGADGMGWHSDSEYELGPEPVIASASFGAPRRFKLRHRRTGRIEALLLEHGDLLIMAGASQRYWQHALPKTKRAVGERINLTFRRIGIHA